MFISQEEWLLLYRQLFAVKDGILSGLGSRSDKEFIDGLDKARQTALQRLMAYYELTLKRRAIRSLPLAVRLTFSIIDYFLSKYRLFSDLKNLDAMDGYLKTILVQKSLSSYRLLSQIVDQSQTSKFTGSFSRTLKELGFEEFSFVSQMRHNLIHQGQPSSKYLESSLVIILREMKRLYWDKQYIGYLELKLVTMEDVKLPVRVKYLGDKLHAGIKGEYFDLMRVQTDFLEVLKTLKNENSSKKSKNIPNEDNYTNSDINDENSDNNTSQDSQNEEDYDNQSLEGNDSESEDSNNPKKNLSKTRMTKKQIEKQAEKFAKKYLRKAHRKEFIIKMLLVRLVDKVKAQMMKVDLESEIFLEVFEQFQFELLFYLIRVITKESELLHRIQNRKFLFSKLNQLISFSKLSSKYEFVVDFFEEYSDRLGQAPTKQIKVLPTSKVILESREQNIISSKVKFVHGEVSQKNIEFLEKFSQNSEISNLGKRKPLKKMQIPSRKSNNQKLKTNHSIRIGTKFSKYLKTRGHSDFFEAFISN